MPFTWKLTVSSRFPAVNIAWLPWPRVGADRKAPWGGVTDPGTSKPSSMNCRRLSGTCSTIPLSTTWPSEIVLRSINGASPRTVISCWTALTVSRKSCTTVRATSTTSV